MNCDYLKRGLPIREISMDVGNRTHPDCHFWIFVLLAFLSAIIFLALLLSEDHPWRQYCKTFHATVIRFDKNVLFGQKFKIFAIFWVR